MGGLPPVHILPPPVKLCRTDGNRPTQKRLAISAPSAAVLGGLCVL